MCTDVLNLLNLYTCSKVAMITITLHCIALLLYGSFCFNGCFVTTKLCHITIDPLDKEEMTYDPMDFMSKSERTKTAVRESGT